MWRNKTHKIKKKIVFPSLTLSFPPPSPSPLPLLPPLLPLTSLGLAIVEQESNQNTIFRKLVDRFYILSLPLSLPLSFSLSFSLSLSLSLLFLFPLPPFFFSSSYHLSSLPSFLSSSPFFFPPSFLISPSLQI